MNTIIALLLASTVSLSAMAAQSKPVDVKEGNVTYRGELILPEKVQKDLPLVVVVPEWWGKNDYPLMRAKRIADEFGYAALVVDLYGEGKVVDDPKAAGDLAGPFYKDPMIGVNRLKAFIAAVPALAKAANVSVDMNKIAVIGYCFGGTQALNLARADSLPKGEDLRGVISYHGGLASPLAAKNPNEVKFLVLHGADDKMVTQKDVDAFKAEMKKAKANLDFHAYPGAVHAFTNPKATEIGQKFGIPIAYNKKADEDSWKRTKKFLSGLFKD